MALVSRTKYGGMINFAEDSSSPSGSVALYAKSAGNGDNEHLVAHAPTASFTGDVHVTGALRVEGNATFDGNVTLGSANSDQISINGEIQTDLIPASDKDLGSANDFWMNVHAGHLYTYGQTTLGDQKIDTVTINGDTTFANGITGSNGINITGGATVAGGVTVAGTAVFNDNITLGSSDSDTITVNAGISSHVYPDISNTRDLGSASKYFRNSHHGALVSYNSFTTYGTVTLGDQASDTITVIGTLTANANVTLGDSASDTVTINGTVGSFTAGTVTGTQFVATSDARLKTDIQLVDNALDAINNLKGVEYDLTTSGEHSMGVLAQDLIEIAPSLVLTGDDGHYAVNYSGLSAFFVEAIKEQQVQIKSQKEQIEELKTMVKQLASK